VIHVIISKAWQIKKLQSSILNKSNIKRWNEQNINHIIIINEWGWKFKQKQIREHNKNLDWMVKLKKKTLTKGKENKKNEG